MVQVPHNPFPRTHPSATPLSGLNVDYSGIIRAGKSLGGAIAGFGEAREASHKQEVEGQRFDVLTKFSAFEEQSAANFEKLKQDTTLNSANFYERAEADFENGRNAFLNDIPADFQDEFEYRTQEVRRGLASKALEFDFKQKGLYYTTKIQDELNTLQKQASVTPELLKQYEGRISGYIDASTLSEIDKAELKQKTAAGLQLVALRSTSQKIKEVRNSPAAMKSSAGVANYLMSRHGFTREQTAGIIGNLIQESNLNPNIVGDGGISFGIGQWNRERLAALKKFGGSNWRDINVQLDFMVHELDTNESAAGRRLRAARTVEQATEAMIGFERPKGWTADNPRAGHGWKNRLANAQKVAGLSITDEDVSNSLLLSPEFGNVDYASAEAAINDGFGAADKALSDELARRKAENESKINALKVGLFDGSAGETDIVQLRNDGVLTDYGDINSSYEILKKRQGEDKNYTDGALRLASGGLWSPGNEQVSKQANALYQKDIAQGLESGDANFVTQTVLPRWQQMNYAAPDMIHSLVAMTNSNDLGKAAFAFETMRQMRETNPLAFDAQFSNDVQGQLDQWEARRNGMVAEDLVRAIQGRDLDQSARQGQKILRADGEQLYKEKDYSPAGFLDSLDSTFTWEPSSPMAPGVAGSLVMEHRAAFIDNYVKYGGDEKLAMDATNKQLARIWGVTEVGGVKTIMRFPPQNAGYRPFDGSYNWIDKQVRDELGLKYDQKFQLVSDEGTEKELGAYMQDNSKPAPSYRVWVQDEWGMQRWARDKDGDIVSIRFARTPEMDAAEIADFKKKQAVADEDTIVSRYMKARDALNVWEEADLMSKTRGTPGPGPKPTIDPELEQRYQDAIASRTERINQERQDDADAVRKAIEDSGVGQGSN